MTVRGNKRLLLVAGVLVLAAAGLDVWNAFGPHGKGWAGLSNAVPFIFFAVLLGGLWARLAKLEAEHGPDYTPPSSPQARTILLIAALVAAGLIALAVVLLLRKG